MSEDNLQSASSEAQAPKTMYSFEDMQSFAGEVAGKVRAEERLKREAQTQRAPVLDAEAMRNVAAEEFKRQAQQMQLDAQKRAQTDFAQKVYGLYQQKLEEGQSRYPDLKEGVENLGLDNFPHVVTLLAGRDDAVEIIKEMVDHPYKLSAVNGFVNYDPNATNQKAAIARLNEISKSIKTNEKAKSINLREPYGQVKPSTAGIDGGTANMTVNDFRKMPFMKA